MAGIACSASLNRSFEACSSSSSSSSAVAVSRSFRKVRVVHISSPHSLLQCKLQVCKIGSDFSSRYRHGRYRRGMQSVAAVPEADNEGVGIATEVSSSGVDGNQTQDPEAKNEGSSLSAETSTNGIEGKKSQGLAGTENVAEASVVRTPEEEEEDRENIRQILRVLELLKINRDMTVNEVRLTVMIEDARDADNLTMMDIEGEPVVSRDEMAEALIDISEGRVPEDRLVLRALRDEMLAWPNLEEMLDRKDPRQSPYAGITDTGVDPVIAAERANVNWDKAAEITPGEQKDLSENLPPAVRFSFLYLVSIIPIIIGVAVVAILYINSFQ